MENNAHRKKILITGGSGFLGWHLAVSLRRQHDVAYTYSSHKIAIPKCRSFYVDFTQPFTIENCFTQFSPEVVIHTAALTDTSECERNPQKAFEINVRGTERLIRRMKDFRTLFIFLSTDLVFDGFHPPYRESDSLCPLSLYGKSKADAEILVRKQWENHAIVRTSLLYGSPNPLGRGSFLQWMEGALRRKEPLTLFHDEFRTPAFVGDVVRAIGSILHHDGQYRVYHLGGPERISRLAFGKRFARIGGLDPSWIQSRSLDEISSAAHRARDVTLDSRRLQNAYLLRWTPIDCALRIILQDREHFGRYSKNS